MSPAPKSGQLSLLGMLQDMHPFSRNLVISVAAGFVAGVLTATFYYVLGQFTNGSTLAILIVILIGVMLVGPTYRRGRYKGLIWLNFAMILFGVAYLVFISAISGGPQSRFADNFALFSFFPLATLICSVVYSQLYEIYLRGSASEQRSTPRR